LLHVTVSAVAVVGFVIPARFAVRPFLPRLRYRYRFSAFYLHLPFYCVAALLGRFVSTAITVFTAV